MVRQQQNKSRQFYRVSRIKAELRVDCELCTASNSVYLVLKFVPCHCLFYTFWRLLKDKRCFNPPLITIWFYFTSRWCINIVNIKFYKINYCTSEKRMWINGDNDKWLATSFHPKKICSTDNCWALSWWPIVSSTGAFSYIVLHYCLVRGSSSSIFIFIPQPLPLFRNKLRKRKNIILKELNNRGYWEVRNCLTQGSFKERKKK